MAPVFILGHYRSGTTYLHELLATDPRYASPNRYQAFNPRTFLTTEQVRGRFVELFMIPRRVQEDEIAFLVMTGLSPYLDWVFPRSPTGYDTYLTFRDADPAERALCPPGQLPRHRTAVTPRCCWLLLRRRRRRAGGSGLACVRSTGHGMACDVGRWRCVRSA